MQRVLSGMQPSGNPHLGNYLGAMRQHVAMQEGNECIYMIVDLHALTTVRDPELMRKYTLELAMDYLALGIDPEKTIFFKQSDVSEHTELAWILSTQTALGVLERAHAWKDAKAKGKKDPTVGLLTYPILMACDILLYNPDEVPVGKDQKQHVEMARDMAEKFNRLFGDAFKLPEPVIKEDVKTVPGTDGQKMSKSYGNTIEMFAEEATLKKQVMSIKTASTPLEEPMNPDDDTVFYYYSMFSTPEETEAFKGKYLAGGFGYGNAKKQLLEKLLDYFADARKKRVELENNLDYVEEVLKKGGERAKEIASATMDDVRKKIGLR